jgi:glycine/D-amino acid oxidase-like deaminating enzyme
VREAAQIDVAVFGGGVAGLWLFNRLRASGFDAHLFERNALGFGQTIASQGIIHSGVKYTFDGINRPQAETLSSMPRVWMDCIEGRGEVDLRGTEIIARHQLMFTTGGLLNRLAGSLATKALRSDVRAVERDDRPELFRAREFTGQVYQLDEPVLAARSVIEALRRPHAKHIHRYEQVQFHREGDQVQQLHLDAVAVRPRACIFTSGAGNEEFAAQVGLEPQRATQRRPLRMFMVRGVAQPAFAHCLVPEPKPRVTITTHRLGDDLVWYLGGNIAEKAVGMSDAEALRWASGEMKAILPWLDWSRAAWAIHDVDRAEPAASKLLPSGPTLTPVGNAALAWPTKLAFAPSLASQAARWLEQSGVHPSGQQAELPLPLAEPAAYPWEMVQEWRRV